MVNLDNCKKRTKKITAIVACRIDTRYLDRLKGRNIKFTDFVNQAFIETFGELKED